MGPNISGGTEYFIFSAEIFSPGGQNWGGGDKNFHDMPPDSPTLACLHAYAYIHIKHPRNPPSKNPGYGPATV